MSDCRSVLTRITSVFNSNSYLDLDILRQKPTDIEVKQLAVNIMEEYGSFEHCKKVLKKYGQEAREEIEKLGGNKFLTEFLDIMQLDE